MANLKTGQAMDDNGNELQPGGEQKHFLDRLREADSGEQVALYRVNGRKLDFIDRYPANALVTSSEADILADVKAEHGGGEYELRLQDAGGVLRGRHGFSIAGLPKRPREEQEPEARQGQSELALILAQMAEQQRRSDERFAQLLAETRQPQGNTMQETLGLVSQVAEVLGKTGATPAPQKSLLEQMTELKQAAELMGLVGGGEGDESGFGWVKDLGPLFGSLLKGGGTEAGDEGNTPPALPSSTANAQQVLLQKLGRVLQEMVQVAKYGVNPENTIADVKAQAGEYWPAFLVVVKRQDALQLAAQLVPAVAEHEQWFVRWRAALLKTQGGEGGDTGKQPAGNGKNGSKRAARAAVASK